MIQNFSYAKVLTRYLAQKHNMKSVEDWARYTETDDFKKNFKNVLPKNPERYYSKANVLRRLKK